MKRYLKTLTGELIRMGKVRVMEDPPMGLLEILDKMTSVEIGAAHAFKIRPCLHSDSNYYLNLFCRPLFAHFACNHSVLWGTSRKQKKFSDLKYFNRIFDSLGLLETKVYEVYIEVHFPAAAR